MNHYNEFCSDFESRTGTRAHSCCSFYTSPHRVTVSQEFSSVSSACKHTAGHVSAVRCIQVQLCEGFTCCSSLSVSGVASTTAVGSQRRLVSGLFTSPFSDIPLKKYETSAVNLPRSDLEKILDITEMKWWSSEQRLNRKTEYSSTIAVVPEYSSTITVVPECSSPSLLRSWVFADALYQGFSK